MGKVFIIVGVREFEDDEYFGPYFSIEEAEQFLEKLNNPYFPRHRIEELDTYFSNFGKDTLINKEDT